MSIVQKSTEFVAAIPLHVAVVVQTGLTTAVHLLIHHHVPSSIERNFHREEIKDRFKKVTSVGKEMQKSEPLCIAGYECKLVQLL